MDVSSDGPHRRVGKIVKEEILTTEIPSNPPKDEEYRKTLTLIYFGPIREKIGLSEEHIFTSIRTPQDLYRNIQERYGLEIPFAKIRVAVNGCIQCPNTLLEADSTVVFLPPFGGG